MKYRKVYPWRIRFESTEQFLVGFQLDIWAELCLLHWLSGCEAPQWSIEFCVAELGPDGIPPASNLKQQKSLKTLEKSEIRKFFQSYFWIFFRTLTKFETVRLQTLCHSPAEYFASQKDFVCLDSSYYKSLPDEVSIIQRIKDVAFMTLIFGNTFWYSPPSLVDQDKSSPKEYVHPFAGPGKNRILERKE